MHADLIAAQIRQTAAGGNSATNEDIWDAAMQGPAVPQWFRTSFKSMRRGLPLRHIARPQPVSRTADPAREHGGAGQRRHGFSIVRPKHSADQRLAVAQSVYGMSDAQLKLAAEIVGGRTLGQAASHLGISVNTARTQLQRMFDKTRVHSQTALVRVLLSTSAPVTCPQD